MITPADGELRDERPPMRISLAVKCLTRLFPAIVRKRSEARHLRLEREAIRLVRQVRACRDRVELERLVGKPAYFMLGTNYGWKSPGSAEWNRPTQVEVYRSRGLIVELLFPRGHDFDTCAYPEPTPWSLAASLIEHGLL